MKKLISLALALAMVFALSIPAIAAHDSTPSTQIMVSLLREKGFYMSVARIMRLFLVALK